MGSVAGFCMGPIWVIPYAGCLDGSHMTIILVSIYLVSNYTIRLKTITSVYIYLLTNNNKLY